jgi:hypothetical protein
VFLVIALARPQSSSSSSNVTTEGISIVIALDISEKLVDHAKHVINIFRRPYLICKKIIKTSSIEKL